MKISLGVLWQLRVEPYLWFMMLGSGIRTVTISQLVQDKLCILVHNQTDQFCRDLSEIANDEDGSDIKSSVLSVSATFNLYYQAIACLPSVIVCLFLGSWCDNYKHGRKILFYVAAIGITLETALLSYMAYDFNRDYRFILLAAVPSALGGGLSTCYTAIMSYIPATTPQSLRTLRFMVFEAIIWLSTPVSTLMGGYLLNYHNEHPIGGNNQLLNYQLVFIVSGLCTISALISVWALVEEKRDKKNLEKFDTDLANRSRFPTQQKRPPFRPLESIIEEDNQKNGFQLLFDWDNVRDIISAATKQRPNRVRLQIWFIVLSLAIVLMAHLAPLYVMYPFARKVYLWDSKTFSLNNSLALFVNSVGILFGTLIMTKLLAMSDIPLTLTGIVAYFMSCVLRATFSQWYGFWSATLVGSIGGTASVGMRSHLSKIVSKHEFGKVFSLVAAIDGLVHFVTNLVFTNILTATIDTFAGAVFDAIAAMIFLPLSLLIYIDLFCRKGVGVDHNKNSIQLNDRTINRKSEQLSYKTKADKRQKRLTTEL